MDPNLISALIGLGGGLVGVAIGAYWQQRSSHAQMCRETTLQLYDRFDDEDILESRIRAEQVLSANARSARPQCLSELYGSLPRADWHHVSRTRHFLDQIGLLHRIGYLDRSIAVPLFGSYVQYWVNRYFGPMEILEAEYLKRTGLQVTQWRVSCAELRRLFLVSASAPAFTPFDDSAISDSGNGRPLPSSDPSGQSPPEQNRPAA
ncbi:MAG TPA: hypothetical protein VFG14_12405 [Chthoniobacteraceae bacterium]|nr:hypothetical protein [Chthoniobacteraceae bacterium]